MQVALIASVYQRLSIKCAGSGNLCIKPAQFLYIPLDCLGHRGDGGLVSWLRLICQHLDGKAAQEEENRYNTQTGKKWHSENPGWGDSTILRDFIDEDTKRRTGTVLDFIAITASQ